MATSDSLRQVPDELLAQQRRALLSGERPSIAELLAGTPYGDDREACLDLLYNEVVVLEELGEQVTPEAYIARYPHLREDIEVHFEIHRAVHGPLVMDTLGSQDATDWGAGERLQRNALLPVADYEIHELLGHGAMSDVFRALDRELHRPVALKVFRYGTLLTERHAARIRTEAAAMARLAHPNILQIFEIGDCDGAPYLALELAEGGTLAERLRRFPLPARAAAELLATLADAVQHAHERQVVHRDLKPANVLFTADGVAKISDFGLAKVFNDEWAAMDVTRTGETVGTPRYMSPEQAAGQHHEFGPATDIYALGTLLYECLTGRAPFVAATVPDTLQMILHDEPVPPRRSNAGIPRDLETICLQCLQKLPCARYLSAAALADDLRRFLRREPVLARRTPVLERAWKWCRRKPAQAAWLASASCACVSMLAGAILAPRWEHQRVERLRGEVATLMSRGHAALQRDDLEQAQIEFHAAWRKVRGEPALLDHSTSVTGWLEHVRSGLTRDRWYQRVPPRSFEDRRDEALLLSTLLIPEVGDPRAAALAAIDNALELTVADDPRWVQERLDLHLLAAELRASAMSASDRLALLDGDEDVRRSRRAGLLRASWLEEAGRPTEAAAQRAAANNEPKDQARELLDEGLRQARNRQFSAAVATLSELLRDEPANFVARELLAVCDLQLQRYAEAQIALTACIAQRPYSSWCFYLRARSESETGAATAAEEDFRRVLDLKPSDAARQAARVRLAALGPTLTEKNTAAAMPVPSAGQPEVSKAN